MVASARGQTESASAQSAAAQTAQPAARTASSANADLYRQLGNVPLDPNAVYKVRDASIDREDVHISLSEGTIAFTRAVNGRITGAIFAGEGEILIVPPDYTERHSLALFAKVAVLSERFSLAYLRFVDDALVTSMQPHFRPAENAAEFIQKHHSLALALSEGDALRALIGLTYAPKSAAPKSAAQAYAGEFLYARLNGEKLGGLEVAFDPLSAEQISVRQLTFTPRGRFYDPWMSFPMQSVRRGLTSRAQSTGEAQVVEITDYKVKMDVRPPTDLAGAATLTLRATQTGARAVLFELSRYLKLSRVEWAVPGEPPVNLDFIQNEALEGSQLARRGNDTVTIIFPTPLVTGQTRQVTFNYAGAVMSDAGGGLLYVGARGTWYPNRGPAMSNYDLEFRHPTEWKLLATGTRVSATTRDGLEESRFVSQHPVPLAGFNLGKYVNTSLRAGEVKLDVYSVRSMEADFERGRLTTVPVTGPGGIRPTPSLAPPPDPSQNAEKVGKKAARMIEFLAPRIGPFPYATLSLTQLPGPNSQGWPGLVFLSSYVFLDREARQRSRFGAGDINDWVFDHLITEHEVAHQWWGNNIFWESYRDQWLMEALANYCALLQLEREDPALVGKLMDYYREGLVKEPRGDERPYKEAGPVRLGLRLNSSRFAGAYEPVVYGRGTWLLHMLRERLKDAAAAPARPATRGQGSAAKTTSAPADPDALFFSVLRDLQTRFAGKTMNASDFLKAFEKALPPSAAFENRKSLDWFYDGWINGSAIPEIKLDAVRISRTAGRTTAAGVILTSDAPELLVTSVPIYAVGGDDSETFVGRIFADGPRTDFSLTVPAGTKKILLDPRGTVLRQP
ncbi:MAG: M1 family aminopeptidase [Terriglobales bacterium]